MLVLPSGGDDTSQLYDACEQQAGAGVVDLIGRYKLTTLDLRKMRPAVLRGTSTLAGNMIGPSYNATTFEGLPGQPIVLMPDNGNVAEPCGWEIGGIKFKGGSDQLYFGNGGVILYLHDLTFEDAGHAGIYAKGFVQDWNWDRVIFRANSGVVMPYGLYYNDEPGSNPSVRIFDKASFRNVRAASCSDTGIWLKSRHSKGVTWYDPVIEANGGDGMVLAGAIYSHVLINPTFEANGGKVRPGPNIVASPYSDLKFLAGPDEAGSPNYCAVLGGQVGARSWSGLVRYGIDAAGYNPKGKLTLMNPYAPGLGNNDPNGVIRMVA